MYSLRIKIILCIFAMSKEKQITNQKNKKMKKKKDLEEIEFQIFRIKYELKQYIDRCRYLGLDPSAKVDELLEQLSELMKKRDKLKD